MEDGGFNFVPASLKIKEYECIVCSHLLNEAMELPCTHMACQSCLWAWHQKPEANKYTDDTTEEEAYGCPECKASYTIAQARRSATADRLILNTMEVKCIMYIHGCPWTGLIKDYHTSHKAECSFSSVRCPFQGCDKIVHRTLIEDHEENCSFRYSECPICNIHVDWKNKDHVCMIPCPNKGCNELIEKSQLQHHTEYSCKTNLILCRWRQYGCLKELPRPEMVVHQAECEVTQIDYVIIDHYKEIISMKQEANKLNQKKLNEITPKHKELKLKAEQLRAEWDKSHQSESMVTTSDGRLRLVNFQDLLMLIQENDIINFMQYTSQSYRLVELLDENGDTLLHHATRYKRPDFVLWLIQFSEQYTQCKPNVKDHDGQNSAQIAVTVDCIPVLQVLLDNQPELLNEDRTSHGSTLLHMAIDLGFEEMAKYICSRVDVDVNVKDIFSKKPDDLKEVSKDVKRMIKNHR